ncbi:hypothetical protein ACQPXT_13185 [Streptomyces sp. CA-100214]
MSHSDPSPQRPSVGRTVHYLSHGTPVREDGTQAFTATCRAATVTEVDDEDTGRVGLLVHNPTGNFWHPLAAGGSRQDEDKRQPASWHWPEVV